MTFLVYNHLYSNTNVDFLILCHHKNRFVLSFFCIIIFSCLFPFYPCCNVTFNKKKKKVKPSLCWFHMIPAMLTTREQHLHINRWAETPPSSVMSFSAHLSSVWLWNPSTLALWKSNLAYWSTILWCTVAICILLNSTFNGCLMNHHKQFELKICDIKFWPWREKWKSIPELSKLNVYWMSQDFRSSIPLSWSTGSSSLPIKKKPKSNKTL